MKHSTTFKLLLAILIAGMSPVMAQVGIGTNTPNGVLEINSSNSGVVYPTASLTDVYVETITNPNAANIVAGTCVFNTNTTDAGIDSVYPGIYIWTGSKWIPQFNKKDSVLFEQDTDVRTGSNDMNNGVLGNQTIPFNSNTITPKFNGPYRVHLTFHYGGGMPDAPTSPQFGNFVVQEGQFSFTFNGTTTVFDMKSFSGINDDRLFKGGSGASTIIYTNSFNQGDYILEESLTRGVPYTFSLTFNQANANGFEGNGDISNIPVGDGRGYLTINDAIKCLVEISYVGD